MAKNNGILLLHPPISCARLPSRLRKADLDWLPDFQCYAITCTASGSCWVRSAKLANGDVQSEASPLTMTSLLGSVQGWGYYVFLNVR